MAKRRQRNRTRRNLILLGCLVALFGGAAVAVRWFNEGPAQILPPLPEPPPVADEDNAYFVMIRARNKVKPHPPLPDFVVKDPAHPDRVAVYETEANSLARAMKVVRPDDDPLFLEYLHEFEPMAEGIREALTKPAIQFPKEDTRGWWYYGPYVNWFDAKGVIALGAALARFEGKPEEGVALLFDLIRLGRRAREEAPYIISVGGAEWDALRQIRLIAQMASPEVLQEMQTTLAALGPPKQSRKSLLETQWRSIDTALHNASSRKMDWDHKLEVVYQNWQLERVIRFIMKHRDEFYKMVEQPPEAVRRWCKAFPEETPYTYGIDPIKIVLRVAQGAASDNMSYNATLLVIAIERWRGDHGGAAPEDLNALTPAYLEAIPSDELSNGAFVYRKTEEGYRLYSAGIDGVDQLGRQDDEMIVPEREQ